MRPFRTASLTERLDNGARVGLDDGWACRIFVLAPDLIRVLFVHPEGLREPRTWMVAPSGQDVPWEGRDRFDVAPFACPRFDIADNGDVVALRTAAVQVTVNLQPFGLRWSRADGVPFAADRSTGPYQWSGDRRTMRHYMARDLADRYFGLGDKTGPLDKHGRRFRTVALDALGYDAKTSDPLYKHWPYVITREAGQGIAYGVFYDTLANASFDLGCEYDNYHGFYRYCEIEDGDLDYYVFLGPTIRDVVRKFADLTGRMPLPPRWSLGYANTAMSLTDAPDAQARLSSFIDEARRHDVPISAFHFGSGYSSIGKRRYVFTWNRTKFPDVSQLVAKFGKAGMRLVANIKPCLLDDHPGFGDVASRGAFVNDAATGMPCLAQFWDGEGAYVDFTHPHGVRWWQGELTRQLLALGIAGWNDNNEYELWDDTAVAHGFGASIPIHRARPLQPLLMTRATYEAQSAHAPDERVYTVTRAGPPGIQRYAQTWSGDNTTSWRTLRWNIRMGLSMSLSGMFNVGHDIGGFAGPVPDAELLVRWVQSGAFSPRFIMNSWKPGGEVNTPWLHPGALPIIRDWIRFRYRLLPYLYTLCGRAARFGEPILRPTFYEFEKDDRAFEDSDDFLVGPNLLVASVVEPGATTRAVYLPEGPSTWVDFWTGKHRAAGAMIDAEAPLARIPLFVPAGGIIPTTDASDMRHMHDEPSRALRIFPGRGSGESDFTLYEDDGRSGRYLADEFAEIAIEMKWSRKAVRLRATKSGRYRLPFDTIRVIAPPGETRSLEAVGEGVRLVSAQ
jgi:alpha-glucosidase